MTQNIALIFPGSGSQYVGMGKKIHDTYDVARKTFQEADDVLGYSLSKICFEGSIIKLNKAANILTSILTVSVACFRVYMETVGISPVFLAGHSLGEYSALCCGGGISFKDSLLIVRNRAELAERAGNQGKGAMTVLKNISPDVVEKICDSISTVDTFVSISCFNSPKQVIISGCEELILIAEKEALKHGAEVVPFIGSPPYHSSLMRTIINDLNRELLKHTWGNLKYPVISNATATPYFRNEDIIDMLLLQMHSPVLWQKTMTYMKDQNIDVLIEVGPQTVLKNLISENNINLLSLSMDDNDDVISLEKFAKNRTNSFDEYDAKIDANRKVVSMCLGIAVSTKNNNTDNAAHHNFVKAYNSIKHIKDSIDNETPSSNDHYVQEALKMLQVIFEVRATPIDEQKFRYMQIVEKTGVTLPYNI